MAAYFVDSSALVKRYVVEHGSAWLTATLHPLVAAEIYVAQVTGPEVVSALTRRALTPHYTTVDAVRAVLGFRLDFAAEYRIAPLTAALTSRAMLIAEHHRLRGYDAVQLAAALEVNDQRMAEGFAPLILLSSDQELNAAAAAEGLQVDDPNLHP